MVDATGVGVGGVGAVDRMMGYVEGLVPAALVLTHRLLLFLSALVEVALHLLVRHVLHFCHLPNPFAYRM